MKQKLVPGMFMDIVSPEELAQHLDSHGNTLLKALGKNAQFKRAIASSVVTAAGTASISISPPDGFLWEIKCATTSAPAISNLNFNLFINTDNPVNIFGSISSGLPTTLFPKCVVHSNEVVIAETSDTDVSLAGTQISLQLWVIEVPNSHEAQLLL